MQTVWTAETLSQEFQAKLSIKPMNLSSLTPYPTNESQKPMNTSTIALKLDYHIFGPGNLRTGDPSDR